MEKVNPVRNSPPIEGTRDPSGALKPVPEKNKDEWLEFDSMINIRPAQSNRSKKIENQGTREKIKQIIEKLII